MFSQRCVITEKDALKLLQDGQKELTLKPGTLITPSAQDVINREGILVRWRDNGNAQQGAAPSKQDQCQSGSTYCLRCGACIEPTCNRSDVGDTAAILAELARFIRENWAKEPSDIQELRKFALPLMGNNPCVFYANFDLFWSGEVIQVCRLQAIEKAVPLNELSLMIGSLLERFAARVSKWKMKDTVTLIKGLSLYFKGIKPQSYDQITEVLEASMVALDRMQSWIDAIIPWAQLDQKLELRSPLSDAAYGRNTNLNISDKTDSKVESTSEMEDLDKLVKRIVAEVVRDME